MGPGKHLCLTGWKQIWTLGGEVLGLHRPPEVAWSSSASREREKEAPDVGKLANAFAELVQCLDDRSLALVLPEEKDDGRKALQVLREHYQGKGKPRIIALYTELTSLEMREGESITDYILRAEKAATALKAADEVISNGLLVAMALKGLPSA